MGTLLGVSGAECIQLIVHSSKPYLNRLQSHFEFASRPQGAPPNQHISVSVRPRLRSHGATIAPSATIAIPVRRQERIR
jgi:hypothetical protein